MRVSYSAEFNKYWHWSVSGRQFSQNADVTGFLKFAYSSKMQNNGNNINKYLIKLPAYVPLVYHQKSGPSSC